MLIRRFMSMLKVVVGCVLFALGFVLFLVPNEINAGGLSGISLAFVTLTDIGSVGLITALLNLPLFLIGGLRIGKKFFWLSLCGTLFSSVFIDVFSIFPAFPTEPLVGALYGGALCGLGLGVVFAAGGSTGGSDIVVRLVKGVRPGWPIGVIAIGFDALVAVLSGLVSGDLTKIFYSGIAIFVSGRIVDAVIYRFDYSRVALIISDRSEKIVDAISTELGRGATYLHGQGCYSGVDKRVILTAVRRQQMTDLKRLVAEIDTNAFVIVLEAHQVLGDGFLRYSNDLQ